MGDTMNMTKEKTERQNEKRSKIKGRVRRSIVKVLTGAVLVSTLAFTSGCGRERDKYKVEVEGSTGNKYCEVMDNEEYAKSEAKYRLSRMIGKEVGPGDTVVARVIRYQCAIDSLGNYIYSPPETVLSIKKIREKEKDI